MSDYALRAAVALLLLTGLGTVLSGAPVPADGVAGQYARLIGAGLGVGLLVAVVTPWVRVPAVAVTAFAKIAFLAAWAAVDGRWGDGRAVAELAMLAALCASGAVFLLDARRQARWDGLPTLRMES